MAVAPLAIPIPATTVNNRRGNIVFEHELMITRIEHALRDVNGRDSGLVEPVNALLHRLNPELPCQGKGMLRNLDLTPNPKILRMISFI